jgi:hypothetical protein
MDADEIEELGENEDVWMAALAAAQARTANGPVETERSSEPEGIETDAPLELQGSISPEAAAWLNAAIEPEAAIEPAYAQPEEEPSLEPDRVEPASIA